MQFPRAHSSGSSPLSHSPRTNERHQKGFGSSIPESTLRKRLQNRIAQRNHRQRMKDRVAELQAKLEVCEKQLQGVSQQPKYMDTEIPGPSSLERHSSSSPSPVASPTAADWAHIDDAITSTLELEPTNCSDEMHESFLIEQGHGSSQPQNKGHQDNSPWSTPCYRDMQLDECGIGELSGQKRIDNENSPLALKQRGDGHESILATSIHGLSTNSLKQPPLTYVNTSPQPNSHGNCTPNIPLAHSTALMTPVSSSDTLSLRSTLCAADVERGMGVVMKCLESAGFGNIDDVFQTYYGQTFPESSVLSDEQRFSRNRRLPGVIANLFRATKTWSAWEARGLYAETLNATEEILISETLEVGSDILSEVTSSLGNGGIATPDLSSIASSLKKNVQSKLPNLWAMVMALAASARPVQRNDPSRTAIAAIILLQCAGHVEIDLVLELVRLCLQ